MPTPKAGTVTTDIAKAIQELKGGKIEFKLDRHGVINNGVGKISFAADKLVENITSISHMLFMKSEACLGKRALFEIFSSHLRPWGRALRLIFAKST